MQQSIHRIGIALFVAVVFWTIGGLEAVAQDRKACVEQCRDERKDCLRAFATELDAAVDHCRREDCRNGFGRRSKQCIKRCKREIKREIGRHKAECKKAFRKDCKSCCATSGVGCSVTVCGDGRIGAEEQCDVIPMAGLSVLPLGCRSDCTLTVCGDGNQDPDEECDDGNTADGDCCSSACTLEGGGSCPPQVSVTPPGELEVSLSVVSPSRGIETLLCERATSCSLAGLESGEYLLSILPLDGAFQCTATIDVALDGGVVFLNRGCSASPVCANTADVCEANPALACSSDSDCPAAPISVSAAVRVGSSRWIAVP